MTVYALILLNIHSPELFEQYKAAVAPLMGKFEGTLLAADTAPTVIEAGKGSSSEGAGVWPYNHSIITSFPSKEAIERWYWDPAYQEAAKYRWQAAESWLLILKENPARQQQAAADK